LTPVWAKTIELAAMARERQALAKKRRRITQSFIAEIPQTNEINLDHKVGII
jgi:hypothetical protein